MKGRFPTPAKFQGTLKTWEPDCAHKLRHSSNISPEPPRLSLDYFPGTSSFRWKTKIFFVEKKIIILVEILLLGLIYDRKGKRLVSRRCKRVNILCVCTYCKSCKNICIVSSWQVVWARTTLRLRSRISSDTCPSRLHKAATSCLLKVTV